MSWNSVSFASKSAARMLVTYTLQYWLKSEPANVIAHEALNVTEVELSGLRANSDYIVQVIAYGSMPASGRVATEPTLKHFRTLISDIDAPQNLQVIRYEPDKANIKWDPVVLNDPDSHTLKKPVSLIKGYRIYYKESPSAAAVAAANGQADLDYSVYDFETPSAANGGGAAGAAAGASDEWKSIDQLGDKSVEVILEDLSTDRDYAIKVS